MDQRLCLSCRFFLASHNRAQGCCLHPDRRLPGANVLVRAGELGCRGGFEIDNWSPALVQIAAVEEDILISERPVPIPARTVLIHVPDLPASRDQAPLE